MIGLLHKGAMVGGTLQASRHFVEAHCPHLRDMLAANAVDEARDLLKITRGYGFTLIPLNRLDPDSASRDARIALVEALETIELFDALDLPEWFDTMRRVAENEARIKALR